MTRVLARLVGWSAGYFLVVLLERTVDRLEEQQRAARETTAATLAFLETEAARQQRCACSHCVAA